MNPRDECSECGGKTIFQTEVVARGPYGPNLLPGLGSFWTPPKFEIYICRECGHCRFFVPERMLPQIETSGRYSRL